MKASSQIWKYYFIWQIDLPYPTPENLAKLNEINMLEGYLYLHVYCSSTYNWKTQSIQMSISQWFKENVIHTHIMDYYSVTQSNCGFTTQWCNWKTLCLVRKASPQRDKYCIFPDIGQLRYMVQKNICLLSKIDILRVDYGLYP